MSTEKTPLVSASRKLAEGTKEFRRLSGLKRWVEKEQEFWSWLNALNQGAIHQSLRTLSNTYRQRLSDLNSKIAAFDSSEDENTRRQRQGQLQASYQSYFQECFDSGLPVSQTLKSIAEIDPIVAGWGLACAHSESMPSGDPKAIEGALRITLFKLGVKERAPGERRALKQLLADIENERNNFEETYQGLIQDVKRRAQNAETVLGDLQAETNVLISDAHSKLKELEDTYDKKLALRKPVQYWRRKGISHYFAAGFLLITLSFIGVYFVSSLVSFAESFIGDADLTLEPWRYVTAFLIAGLGIWGLRVGVKIMISQLHLASDSRQRATLILTYLALLREGKGLDENDKELILNVVFQPGQSGLLQDSTGPSTSLDRLVKLISGSGK